MLMVRLQRVGKKHEPLFRLVLTEAKNAPRSGKFLEILGSYDPRNAEKTGLKTERIKYWIASGAKLSDTVHNLFVEKKVIAGKKKNVLPKKTSIKKPEEPKVAEEVAPAESAEIKEASEGDTAPNSEPSPEAVTEETPSPEEQNKPQAEVAEEANS